MSSNSDAVEEGLLLSIALPKHWLLLPVGQFAASGGDGDALPDIGLAPAAVEAARDVVRIGDAIRDGVIELVLAACGVELIDGTAVSIGTSLGVLRVASDVPADERAHDADVDQAAQAPMGAFIERPVVTSVEGREARFVSYQFGRLSDKRSLGVLLSFVVAASAPRDAVIERLSGFAASMRLDGEVGHHTPT